MTTLDAVMIGLGLVSTVVGSLALIKLRGKAPPDGKRLR